MGDCDDCTAGYYCNNSGNTEPVECGTTFYSVRQAAGYQLKKNFLRNISSVIIVYI